METGRSRLRVMIEEKFLEGFTVVEGLLQVEEEAGKVC